MLIFSVVTTVLLPCYLVMYIQISLQIHMDRNNIIVLVQSGQSVFKLFLVARPFIGP